MEYTPTLKNNTIDFSLEPKDKKEFLEELTNLYTKDSRYTSLNDKLFILLSSQNLISSCPST